MEHVMGHEPMHDMSARSTATSKEEGRMKSSLKNKKRKKMKEMLHVEMEKHQSEHEDVKKKM